jgi:hypothetical protein
MRRENKKKREGHTWHVWRRKGFIRSERRERNAKEERNTSLVTLGILVF